MERGPAPGMRRHSNFRRFFWPTWFGHDNVFPSPDHLPWLQGRFRTVKLEERLGKVPYLPLNELTQPQPRQPAAPQAAAPNPSQAGANR